MYLVSLYFDDKTDKIIRKYIKKIASESKNTYMIDNSVPPHITLSAFETQKENVVIEQIEQLIDKIGQGTIKWVSVGAFLPHVLYVQPVLDTYLYELSESLYNNLKNINDILIQTCYQPFNWIPHTTLAKKLSEEDMIVAFKVLSKSFTIFEGRCVKITVTKTNPYRDIRSWDL